jgi:hypothetical protein
VVRKVVFFRNHLEDHSPYLLRYLRREPILGNHRACCRGQPAARPDQDKALSLRIGKENWNRCRIASCL